mmetsp:Transcript_30138/g.71802  ORF Transcript_30138/g.71802 Transcript_30138/m.71802 type:complete len:204 (-) Transcript_30138:1110-1721(-)
MYTAIASASYTLRACGGTYARLERTKGISASSLSSDCCSDVTVSPYLETSASRDPGSGCMTFTSLVSSSPTCRRKLSSSICVHCSSFPVWSTRLKMQPSLVVSESAVARRDTVLPNELPLSGALVAAAAEEMQFRTMPSTLLGLSGCPSARYRAAAIWCSVHPRDAATCNQSVETSMRRRQFRSRPSVADSFLASPSPSNCAI